MGDETLDYAALLDQRLEAPFWPEPVQIIRLEPLGSSYMCCAEGLQSRQLHRTILQPQELQVLLEQSAQRLPFQGDPEWFALGVEAHRIRLGYTFDPFFAVWASRVDPLPHQLEAVYGILLKKPRVRFLLADDPGAGKTIMAGLLLKEMKYRGQVKRVLIVVPANLTDQWRRELKEKFNETFVVINRYTIEAQYQENVWQKYDSVITSVDFAKREPYRFQLQASQWDLIIVDEAHKLSAKRYGAEVTKSLRYRLGEILSQISTHLLFLTATPHSGDEEQFRLLLNLLETDLFANTKLLKQAASAGENPIFLRRLKEDMVDFEGKPLFPPRYVHTATFQLSEPEKRLYDKVTNYVREHFNRAWEEKQRTVGLAMSILQRRLASSTYAVVRSLENRWKRLQELRETVLQEEFDIDEEELDMLPEEERWRREEELIQKLTLARNRSELEREIQELGALVQTARSLTQQEEDTKLQELLKVVARLRPAEKLLIFTEHKDTLNFLVKALRKRGYHVTSIDGSMSLEERVKQERVFRDEAQILVATEAAGEGINLQFCAVMVNYDLPWNPTRLEQRMGRIHRYGQRYEVHIYNLVAANTREGQVLQLLLDKLETMRQELGSDRVYDVVGELLEGISLEQLILEHLLGRRTLADIQALVEAQLQPQRLDYLREITLEALAKREVDLTRLRQDLAHSHTQRLEPEYTQRFFCQALKRLGGEVTRRTDGLFTVRVPHKLREAYRLPLAYPRATFDPHPHQPKAYLDVELLGPGHPLFDAVVAEVIRQAEPHLHQGVGLAVPGVSDPFYLGYWVLSVRNGLGHLVSQRLVALAQDEQGIRIVPPALVVDAVPTAAPPATSHSSQTMSAWAVDHLLPAYRDEIAQQQRQELEIRRKYGLQSLDYLIAESSKKLSELKVRSLKGEDLNLPIQNEERRLEQLRKQRDELEKRLAREEQLWPEPLQLLAQAYVVPLALEGEAEDPQVRQQVEQVAMQVAMAFEQQQGRHPRDVSRDNLGYDIESGGRCIEVKGRAGTGAIVLTANEWIAARRLGKDYWLYVVTQALTQPQLHLIQNPAAKLRPNQELDVVRYVVAQADWQRWAELPTLPT